MIKNNSALLMIDIQNDFIPNGSLAVSDGEEVVALANELQKQFDLVIATQDWHPKEHVSFALSHPGKKVGDVIDLPNGKQVLWPIHCLQGSVGASFHPDLDTSRVQKIFYKGVEQHVDSYSAFFDNNHAKSTGLVDYLREKNVDTIYVMGLATDYCVKFTVLDARELGFNVYLIVDACRGVEQKKGDIQAAIDEMKMAGVQLITMSDVIA